MREALLKIDPASRLLIFLVFSSAIAISRSPLVIASGLILVLLIALFSPQRRVLLRRALVAQELLLFILVFLPFTHHGRVLFTLGPLSVTEEGVKQAVLIFVRSSVILWGSVFFLSSLEPASLIYGLSKLRFPPKLLRLALFTIRYISVMEMEYNRLRKAMRARAFKPRTDLHTYRSYAYLLGMLLVRSHERAERVYKAMLARGFGGSLGRGPARA